MLALGVDSAIAVEPERLITCVKLQQSCQSPGGRFDTSSNDDFTSRNNESAPLLVNGLNTPGQIN